MQLYVLDWAIHLPLSDKPCIGQEPGNPLITWTLELHAVLLVPLHTILWSRNLTWNGPILWTSHDLRMIITWNHVKHLAIFHHKSFCENWCIKHAQSWQVCTWTCSTFADFLGKVDVEFLHISNFCKSAIFVFWFCQPNFWALLDDN